MELHIVRPATITGRVIVRHKATCKHKAEGTDYKLCTCRKSLLVYEGNGSGSNRRISTKTRSWEKAEEFLRDWLDTFDPAKVEIKRLRAELERDKERASVSIEDAVALFHADMITRLGDNGSVKISRALLGHIDAATKERKQDGHLFKWLDTLNAGKHDDQRVTYISQITPAHLTAWRGSWNFGSDLTAFDRWKQVRGFFKFCDNHGWTNKTEGNPALKLRSLEKTNGSRTTVFSDEQYAAILAAIPQYDGGKVAQQRLLCFVELLRWAGMAIGDGLHFRPEMINADGVLQYHRRKNGELATIPMPQHVLKLLRAIPLENSAADMPFRTKNATAEADLRKWDTALRRLFKLAGIVSVQTPMGKEKKPHAHMLRDTFAVWHLSHGAQLRTVSKMLGHSETTTTERSYLPWVKQLEEAHIADGRKALENGKAGKRTKKSS